MAQAPAAQLARKVAQRNITLEANMSPVDKQSNRQLQFLPVTQERLSDLARFSMQHGKLRYKSV